MSEIYDRMHPDKNEFIKRIENYSKITYGTDAYSLSAKEALLILDLKAKYQKAVEAIIILVDDAELYSDDVRKLTAFFRIKRLAAELGEKE